MQIFYVICSWKLRQQFHLQMIKKYYKQFTSTRLKDHNYCVYNTIYISLQLTE